jgi:hypothetical protein
LHYRREITHFQWAWILPRSPIELANSPAEEFRQRSSTVRFFRPGGGSAYAPSLHPRIRVS